MNMPEKEKKQLSLKELTRTLNRERFDRTGYKVVAELYGTAQRFAVVGAELDETVKELVLVVKAEAMEQ